MSLFLCMRCDDHERGWNQNMYPTRNQGRLTRQFATWSGKTCLWFVDKLCPLWLRASTFSLKHFLACLLPTFIFLYLPTPISIDWVFQSFQSISDLRIGAPKKWVGVMGPPQMINAVRGFHFLLFLSIIFLLHFPLNCLASPQKYGPYNFSTSQSVP